MIICIDGPAGAGKSTVAKKVAETLGYTYIDTGAIYRSIAWLAMQKNIPFEDEANLVEAVEHSTFFSKTEKGVKRFFVDTYDVTEAIRTPEASQGSSKVAILPGIRAAILNLQRQMAEGDSAVVEGRDTGTVVFPDADLKIFLVASVDERARRRLKDFGNRETDETLESVKKQIEERDYRDYNRETSPLKKADNAIEVDTTGMSIEEVVGKIVSYATERNNR